MRISDWSSDVCSSELALLRHAGEDALVVLVEKVVDAEVDAQPLQRSLARLPGEEDVVHVVGVALLAGIVDLVELGGESAAPAEIGRESGRERVCQDG